MGGWNRGKNGGVEERREAMVLWHACGGWCFLCHCSPILSPENVTLPLGGSAPRRDSSVWLHLPRCSMATSRRAWEASHCTLSAHPRTHCFTQNLQRAWSFSHTLVFWKEIMHLKSYIPPVYRKSNQIISSGRLLELNANVYWLMSAKCWIYYLIIYIYFFLF